MRSVAICIELSVIFSSFTTRYQAFEKFALRVKSELLPVLSVMSVISMMSMVPLIELVSLVFARFLMFRKSRMSVVSVMFYLCDEHALYSR